MGKRVVDDASLTAIADKLREELTPDEKFEFPGGFIDGIDLYSRERENRQYTQGYTDGEQDGYSNGYQMGEFDGYEMGERAEYDRFWDTYQQSGERTDYKNGFYGPNWTDETFAPKYDLICTDCNSMFNNVRIKDIAGILERQGVIFDTSACTNVNSLFYTTQKGADHATSIPAVDVSTVSNINATFYGQSRVKKIELLNVQENAIFTRAFHGCAGLVDLIITGTIGGDGLDLSRPTALSKTSIEDVIGCLSMNTSGLSITLSKTAVEAAFTDEEWTALENTRTNWTINLA